MINFKNSRRAVSLVLSISILSSVLSPSLVQAGFFSSAKTVGPASKNLFQKFVGMFCFGKKKPVVVSKAEQAKIILAKVAGKSIAITSAAGKYAWIGTKGVGNAALTATKFTGKTIFNTAKLLVYTPIAGMTKFTTKATINGSKFVAKNFSQGYIRTFGQATAIGTIVGTAVVGGALLGSAIVLSAMFFGFKYGIRPWVKGLNDKFNPRRPGSASNPEVVVQPKKEVSGKFKDGLDNLKNGEIKNGLGDLGAGLANGLSNVKDSVVDFFDPKVADFTRDLKGAVSGGTKKASDELSSVVIHPVTANLKKFNNFGKDLVNKINGEQIAIPSVVAPNNAPVVGESVLGNLVTELVRSKDLPSQIAGALGLRGKKEMATRIDFLNLPEYERNKGFRDLCSKIWGEPDNGQCYYDHLVEVTSRPAAELGISDARLLELTGERDRMRAELDNRLAIVDGRNRSKLDLLKELAWKEIKCEGHRLAVIVPTFASKLIDKGAKIVFDNRAMIYRVGGASGVALVTVSALIYQPPLLGVVPVTLGLWLCSDKVKQAARFCKEKGCQKLEPGLRVCKKTFKGLKDKVEDDLELAKERGKKLLDKVKAVKDAVKEFSTGEETDRRVSEKIRAIKTGFVPAIVGAKNALCEKVSKAPKYICDILEIPNSARDLGEKSIITVKDHFVGLAKGYYALFKICRLDRVCKYVKDVAIEAKNVFVNDEDLSKPVFQLANSVNANKAHISTKSNKLKHE